MKERDYYPFGLTMAGISSKAAGKLENKFKYNGKELEGEFDLNWTAMDFRGYDAQIGRFHSQDVLADLAPSMNPYRFGFNNPVFWSDPTGLYEYDKNGNLVSNGLQEGEIDFISNYIINNGIEGLDFALQGAGFALDLDNVVVTPGSNRGESSSSDDYSSIGNIVKWGVWGVNTGVGVASAYTVYKGAYLTSNELWHRTMTKPRNTYTTWSKLKNGQRAFDNPLIKRSQTLQANKVATVRGIGDKLTKAGAVLLVADIALSGELKPSHGINAAMLAASTTGVGAIVAGVWFLADFGTMGVNYLLGNGAKGIGDMIDESLGTYKMYDGVY